MLKHNTGWKKKKKWENTSEVVTESMEKKGATVCVSESCLTLLNEDEKSSHMSTKSLLLLTHRPLCTLESRQAVLQEKSLLDLRTSPALLVAGISVTDCPFWTATERQLLTEKKNNSVKSESKDGIFEKN